MAGYAWVTLATNDSYSLGALVLAHSLRRVGTKHDLVVLVTPGVTDLMREKLAAVFTLVQEVNVLDSKDEANLALLARPELGITFTKLHCWRLTQYNKCVFVDADALVIKNCDELFEREELSAAPDVGWPDCFNSGVFVFKPSDETFASITAFATSKGSFDGGDQGLLNMYFNDWAWKDINKHLPFIYNMCSTATYSYLPAFKQFGENVRIIHFIGGTKPWLQYFDTLTGIVQPPQNCTHLQPLLQLWWNIFCDNVHPQLSPVMASSTLAPIRHKLTPKPYNPQPTNFVYHNIDNQSIIVSSNDEPSDFSEFKDPWDEYCNTNNQEIIEENNQEVTVSHPQYFDNNEQNYIDRERKQEQEFLYISCDKTFREECRIISQDHNYHSTNFHKEHNIQNLNFNRSEQYNNYNQSSQISHINKHECHQQNEHHINNEPQQTHIQNQNQYFSDHETTRLENSGDNKFFNDNQTKSNDQKINCHIQKFEKIEHSKEIEVHVNDDTDNFNHNFSSQDNSTNRSEHHIDDTCIHSETNNDKSCPSSSSNKDTQSIGTHSDTKVTGHLDSVNAGLAGALAQITIGEPRSAAQIAFEEHMRKQSWEQGQIDFMGRDSFDNIWKKICQTLSEAPKRQPTPPKEVVAPKETNTADSDSVISAPVTAAISQPIDAQSEVSKDVSSVCTSDEKSSICLTLAEKSVDTTVATESEMKVQTPELPEQAMSCAKDKSLVLATTADKQLVEYMPISPVVKEPDTQSSKVLAKKKAMEENENAQRSTSPIPLPAPSVTDTLSSTETSTTVENITSSLLDLSVEQTDPKLVEQVKTESTAAPVSVPYTATEEINIKEKDELKISAAESSALKPVPIQVAESVLQTDPKESVTEDPKLIKEEAIASTVASVQESAAAFSETPIEVPSTTQLNETMLITPPIQNNGFPDFPLNVDETTSNTIPVVQSDVQREIVESVAESAVTEIGKEELQQEQEKIFASIPVEEKVESTSAVETKSETVPAVEETKTEIVAAVEEIKSEIAAAVEEKKPEIAAAVEEIKSEIAAAVEEIKPEIAAAVEEKKSEVATAVEEMKTEVAATAEETKSEIATVIEEAKAEVVSAVDDTKKETVSDTDEVKAGTISTVEEKLTVESEGMPKDEKVTKDDKLKLFLTQPKLPESGVAEENVEFVGEKVEESLEDDSPMRPTRTKELKIPSTPIVTEATPPTSPPIMPVQETETELKTVKKTVKKTIKKTASESETGEGVAEGDGNGKKSAKKVVKKVTKKTKDATEETGEGSSGIAASSAEKVKKTSKSVKKTAKSQTLDADSSVPETPPPVSGTEAPVPPKRKTKVSTQKSVTATKPDVAP